MKPGSRTVASPYLLYMVILCALSAFFLGLYTLVTGIEKPSTFEQEGDSLWENAKLIQEPESYQVTKVTIEDSNAFFAFPELQVVKSKFHHGMQAIVKKGHVIAQFPAQEDNKMIYFIGRTEQQEDRVWTQVDLVAVDPIDQSVTSEPIGFTYGASPDTVYRMTKLCGFLNRDEILYATLKNEEEKLVYQINRFSLSKRTVSPLLELYSYEMDATAFSQIIDIHLSPDRMHLWIRQKETGLYLIDLKNGKAKRLIPPPEGDRQDDTWMIAADGRFGLYTKHRFSNEVLWFDLNTGESKPLFTEEPGWMEAGTDRQGKVIYSHFTLDRSVDRIIGDWNGKAVLASSGVQLADGKGKLLKRFSLPKAAAQERLEFVDYSEDQKSVLLHQFKFETDAAGKLYKKTVNWLLGDVTSGAMNVLQRVDVPDSWDKKEVMFGTVRMSGRPESGEQQIFAHPLDHTYFMPQRQTNHTVVFPDDDLVLFADESSKRVFLSSLTRPDLIVAALNYKKYNWDNHDFVWMNGGQWISRFKSFPDGDKIYFSQIN